jgi:hypothetical protein
MPKLLERLSQQLQAKGMAKAKAYAVATSQMQKAGNLKPNTQELTPKGKARQAMGAKGRAIDRAAKSSTHAAKDFVYSSKTNRATVKK